MATPTPSTAIESMRTARSLLQLIALLLPVIAILIQVTISSFKEEPRPHPIVRVFVLIGEGIGVGFLMWGWFRISTFLQSNVRSSVISDGIFLISIGLSGVSIVILMVLLSPLIEALMEWFDITIRWLWTKIEDRVNNDQEEVTEGQ